MNGKKFKISIIYSRLINNHNLIVYHSNIYTSLFFLILIYLKKLNVNDEKNKIFGINFYTKTI